MRSTRADEDEADEEEWLVGIRKPAPTESELLARVARRYEEIIEEPLTFDSIRALG